MDVWKNLEQFKAAVQEGVKEFSNVAINEVRHGVQTIQVGLPPGTLLSGCNGATLDHDRTTH